MFVSVLNLSVDFWSEADSAFVPQLKVLEFLGPMV